MLKEHLDAVLEDVEPQNVMYYYVQHHNYYVKHHSVNGKAKHTKYHKDL